MFGYGAVNRDLPFWTEWRRAITVVCVNIERSFPYIRDELLMELIVDVMLEDALNLNWLFNTPPKPENLQATLQHVHLLRKILTHHHKY
jgi:hypothetical protein